MDEKRHPGKPMNTFLKNILKDEKKIIFVLLITSLLFRLFFLKNNSFIFRWDQARDAVISRTIIEEKDIKIQGPSASGTQDQIYHGVLYYYLIAPLYTFSGGDPRFVVFALTLLFTTSVIPVYFFVKSFSKSKLMAIIVGILFSISIDTATTGTWLSNPIIALFSISFFYWRLWEVFFEDNRKNLWLLALSLGISNQSVIFSLYLIIPLFFSYLYAAYQKKKIFIFSFKQYLVFIAIYITSISTMILSQYNLYRHGIFKLSTFTETIGGKSNIIDNIPKIIELYIKKLQLNLIPQSKIISLVIFLPILAYFFKKINLKQRVFYTIYFFSVFIFLMLQYRNSFHSFIGMSLIVFIPISFAIEKIITNFKKSFSLFFLIIFFFAHLSYLSVLKNDRYSIVGVEQGFFFGDKLELIDKLYQEANNNTFTISSFTIPYGYNTTWSYLFGWYGEKNYGYKPSFYGPDQRGIFGEHYLETTLKSGDSHFTIYEPSVDLNNDVFILDFMSKQDAIGAVTDKYSFGTINVEKRK